MSDGSQIGCNAMQNAFRKIKKQKSSEMLANKRGAGLKSLAHVRGSAHQKKEAVIIPKSILIVPMPMKNFLVKVKMRWIED